MIDGMILIPNPLSVWKSVCICICIIITNGLTKTLLFRMLIPKKNRTSIYEYLFKEGVMVAKKDFNAPRHPDLETVPNLQVIKAMQVWKLTSVLKYLDISLGYHMRVKAVVVLSHEDDIVKVIVLKAIKLFDIYLSSTYYFNFSRLKYCSW